MRATALVSTLRQPHDHHGPAFDTRTNLVYVGGVDWCTTVKLQTWEEIVASAPGQM
jgi:hypothetical protein